MSALWFAAGIILGATVTICGLILWANDVHRAVAGFVSQQWQRVMGETT